MRRGAMASYASTARLYAFPIILFSLGVLWQLFVLPRTFPPSHYEVIGVKSNSSFDEIVEAYERLTSECIFRKFNKDMDIVTENVIEVQHAFEVLSNELRRRDYDLFNVDELQDIAKTAKQRYVGDKVSRLELPLLKTFEDDFMDEDSKVLTSQNFGVVLQDETTWLIQIYSLGSASCQKFSPSWNRIVTLLDGVANTGKVELGEVQTAAYLAERNQVTGLPFFRYGLPSLVAFPANCRNFKCLLRYSGELNADAVVDWIATDILGLPRILYYSPEALVREFIRKPAPHKVKVIFFSKTGHRAAPFLRRAARDYQEYASFGFVLWQEENAQLWWNMFEVESAPAIAFLKDPGVKFVHYGPINSSDFQSLMEQHKIHALPQLRSITSMELGCDPRGHSPAGNGSIPWYCVIIAGKPGFKLSKAREVLRSVQDNLTNEAITDAVDISSLPVSLVAAQAFKEKRLTLGWLDGTAQKRYCLFYLSSENVTETCGPKNYEEEEDVPKLFLVRYQRNISEANVKVDKRFKPAWDLMNEDVSGLASQLVAKYNGSIEIPEILSWISDIIKEGDSKDLPYYRTSSPELVPEEPKPAWSGISQRLVYSTRRKMQERIKGFAIGLSDYMRDPRIGPILFLAAALYMGSIWLSKHQIKKQNEQGNNAVTDMPRPESSITDEIPRDAYQALESDTESEE